MVIGDRDFETWYRDERTRLVRTLTVACRGDVDLAADAADEAMVRACERWSRIRHMDSPAAWTYRTALNVVRRRHRRRTIEERLLRRVAASTDHHPADHSTELWSVVAELDHRDRAAIALRYVAGLSEAQVAEALGMSTGGASSVLSRARAQLRHALTSGEVPVDQ